MSILVFAVFELIKKFCNASRGRRAARTKSPRGGSKLRSVRHPSTTLRGCDFIVFVRTAMLKTKHLRAPKVRKFKKVTNAQGRF